MSKNGIKQIKKIDLKKMIYPAILLAYFVVIGVFLFFSLKFFSKELSMILVTDDQLAIGQNQPALDAAGYGLLEKKFKLTANVEPESSSLAEPETTASSTGTSTADSIASSTETNIESTSTAPLTISILNSTRVAGLAGKLKKILEVAGWPVAKIGNLSPALATTTINLSPESVSNPGIDAIESLLTESGLLYTENRLDEAGNYDLEIIIGDH